jgi:periplasmic divalent cation tolerance protein
MTDSTPIAVVTTVGQREDALRLAQMALDRQLAACVQLSAIESLYVWEGRPQHEPEVRLVFKTTAALYDRLEAAIREIHPYELPAIHALAFDRVLASYAQWIADSTAQGLYVDRPADARGA